MANNSKKDEESQDYEDYMRMRNELEECSINTSTESKILYLSFMHAEFKSSNNSVEN